MQNLLQAASDFLAALLGWLGFVGRPRRRAGIREDLELLGRLRDAPEFGVGSDAHRFLMDHVTREVAELAGVELKRKKHIPWSSVVVSLIIGLPLAYWTYTLNEESFRWYSVFPGLLGGLLLIAAVGMVVEGEQPVEDGEADSP